MPSASPSASSFFLFRWRSDVRTDCFSVTACQPIARLPNFDFTVFDRALTGRDYLRKTGPVYQLIWGRNMSPATAATFAEKVDAEIIVTGHQPQETGYFVNGEHHLILASEHNQGVFLPIDLGRPYDMPGLVDSIRKFVALDV